LPGNGGDALDAVLAALGAVRAWARATINISPDTTGILWKGTYMFEALKTCIIAHYL
jgi:hypothetical protein